MEKIVYFAAAIRGDRGMFTTVKELINYIKHDLNIKVLTEHITSDDPRLEFATKFGKTIEQLSMEDIEKTDIAWLDEAEYVIAEISGPSTGTGREIEYARNKHHFGKKKAKILCLYREDKEYTASAMITGMTKDRYPNIDIVKYKDTEEAKRIIAAFLG